MTANEFDNDETKSVRQLSVGTLVSHYKIESKIGAGGMGEVYLAADQKLKRKVALKFLPPYMSSNSDSLKRFRREAEAAALFSHPNIVAIHDVDEFDNRPFIVMEYVSGKSLSDLIETSKLGFDKVADLSIQICDALTCAHQSGVIHRDLKLSNILVDESGRVRLVDFGLAAVRDSDDLTKSGHILGTSGYMSPEQISGESVDHRSDIFSFGVVLYELLTGQHPFRKENPAATSHAICNLEPAPVANHRANIPQQYQDIVNKALEKDKALRYQHIDELKTDLLRYQSGIHKQQTVFRFRRRFNLTALAVILALAILITISNDVRTFILNLINGSTSAEEIHLAVLPFSDLSDSNWGRLFCDGLRETITSRLTQMNRYEGSLWVVPSSEVTSRNVESVHSARNTFGVTMVVTGSVQELGEKVRLVLNLVDAKTERQIRSELIDVQMSNLVQLQDSTVSKMVTMLHLSVQPSNRKHLTIGGTNIPEAYGAYLIGRGYLKRSDKLEAVDSAIAKFREAVDLDSRYALAYAGLGEAYWWRYKLTNEPDLVGQATGNSQLALAISDSLAEVHLSLGRIYRGLHQYNEALVEYNLANEILPNNHLALRGLARSYEELGNIKEAQANYQKVIDSRPNYWAGYFDMALFHIYGNRQSEALPYLEKAAQLVPQNSPDLNDIGAAYLMTGDNERAIEVLNRSIALEPTYPAYSNLGYLLYTEGNFKDAADAYEQALAINSSDYKVWGNLGSAYEMQPGLLNKSKESYKRAIVEAQKRRDITPNDPALLANLASFYAADDDTTQARAMADAALAITEDDTQVLVTLVFAMEDIGDRQSAVKYLSRAIELGYAAEELRTFPNKESLLEEPEIAKLLNN